MEATPLAPMQLDADAFTRAMRGLCLLLEALSPEEVDAVARRLDHVLAPLPERSADLFFEGDETVLAARSQRERLERALTDLLENFRRRRALLADALTTTQVAQLLGCSRQTPHRRVRAGRADIAPPQRGGTG